MARARTNPTESTETVETAETPVSPAASGTNGAKKSKKRRTDDEIIADAKAQLAAAERRKTVKALGDKHPLLPALSAVEKLRAAGVSATTMDLVDDEIASLMQAAVAASQETASP